VEEIEHFRLQNESRKLYQRGHHIGQVKHVQGYIWDYSDEQRAGVRQMG
jgi:hypothetical protein